MKLSDYAKKAGVHYHTAWRWFKSGKLKGYQMDTGTIIITEDDEPKPPDKIAIYTRVSSHEMRENLNRQAERLIDYCTAKGWQVHKVIKEVGSGVNDNRKQFLKLLADPTITIIVVEHKDRATRFGFNYLDTLLSLQGRRIEVVNLADNGTEDLLHDLVAIIYSFCARLYGQRRAKRKTEKITQELQADD
jgi:predicted site-specific integrase-resolvase